MRIRTLATVLAGLALAPAIPAFAQYTLDMTEEAGKAPHIRYFGSAKDDKGKQLGDVTVLLVRESSSYVFVTNAGGRFSGALPVSMRLSMVTPKCIKSGFQTVRIAKRTATVGKKSSAQVDCIMRRAPARG